MDLKFARYNKSGQYNICVQILIFWGQLYYFMNESTKYASQ